MPLPPLGEAHVYYIDLTQQVTAVYLPLLSPDERQRADRYRVENARTQFIVTRGALRTLLGRYLDCQPAQIGLTYGAAGKPSLNSLAPALQFSVSHSGTLSALAFAPNYELGIDIEHIRPMPEMQAIARGQFSPEQCAGLFSAPEHIQRDLFFRFWTAKEALAKATGLGIAAAPIDVAHWFRHDLEPVDGYVGTLFTSKAARVVVFPFCP